MAKAKFTKPHVVEELEGQFHSLHRKISKARDNYVATHQKELAVARKQMKVVQAQLNKARIAAGKSAAQAKKSGSKAARNQLKKARAASLLLGNAMKEAKEILVTAESRLHSAKPFDRKLAARARLLEQFEKDWEKKMQSEAAARTRRAKLAAARRRATAKQRAVRQGTA
ncbi:MAG: hypothetical protein WD772_01935 [Pseudohongiellaceae bacterium]